MLCKFLMLLLIMYISNRGKLIESSSKAHLNDVEEINNWYYLF